MPDHSPHQKKIIERYYDNRSGIMLTKLGDIVTELYLADSDRKRDNLWGRAEKAMKGLKIQPTIIRHILKSRDPQVLARNLRGWLGKKVD